MTYGGGGNSPDLEVVRAHEDVGNVGAHLAHNPLVEVLGLRLGDSGLQRSVDQTIEGRNLVLLGQHRDVVLERVRDPEALVANVGDALMVVPVVLLGQGLVEAVVEVLVVGEDNVAANIVQLPMAPLASATSTWRGQTVERERLTKPSGVTSVAARPPALSPESTINHEGPFYVAQWSVCAV